MTWQKYKTLAKLIKKIVSPSKSARNKITIVGLGQVGMACAISILTQYVSSHVCLIDKSADKCRGEKMDLQHGSSFINNAIIEAGTDYALSCDSKICIIAAGVKPKVGETRLANAQVTVDIIKDIVPKLVKHAPHAILLVVTNPVDILAYIAMKISGLPQNQVIGSGTKLDSSRFRQLISEKLKIAPTSVHGYMIGEHGDTCIPVWSAVNVCGTRLVELNPDIATDKDPENWAEVSDKVVTSPYEIVKLKGHTSWAIGLSTAHICRTILTNTQDIHSVSTSIQGIHGVEEDVFLSLPVVLAHNGVSKIIIQDLSEKERDKFQKAAKIMHKIQSRLDF